MDLKYLSASNSQCQGPYMHINRFYTETVFVCNVIGERKKKTSSHEEVKRM